MFQRWSSNAKQWGFFTQQCLYTKWSYTTHKQSASHISSNCTDEIRSVHIRVYSQTGKCVGAHLPPFSLSVV